MRPVVLVLVALALGIASLTAMLANRFLAPPAPPPPVAAGTGEDVLVVAGEVKAGAVLRPEDLRWETWPAGKLDNRLVRRNGGADPTPGFIGAIARRPLLPGEPVTANAVFRQGDGGGPLSGLLAPGMRAVTIAVSPTGDVSGFVLPNDRVDVLLNADLNRSGPGGGNGGNGTGGQPHYASEVLLADLRVLAVDDKLVKPENAQALSGRSVTLEVTPKDAELLQAATRLGDLVLALRSLVPGEGELPPSGFTTDIESSRAVQAVLGLAPSAPASPPAAPALAADALPQDAGQPHHQVRVNRAGTIVTQSFAN